MSNLFAFILYSESWASVFGERESYVFFLLSWYNSDKESRQIKWSIVYIKEGEYVSFMGTVYMWFIRPLNDQNTSLEKNVLFLSFFSFPLNIYKIYVRRKLYWFKDFGTFSRFRINKYWWFLTTAYKFKWHSLCWYSS